MDDMQMLRTLRSDVPPPAGDRMETGRLLLDERPSSPGDGHGAGLEAASSR